MLVTVALGGLLALTGCGNDLAERRIRMRRDSLDWASRKLAWREQVAQQRLERDFEFIGKSIERDAREFEQDIVALGELIERDVERWEQRQDDYRRKLYQIFLEGDYESIERSALLMFL